MLTVKELIEQLKEYPLEMNVIFLDSSGYELNIDAVEISEGKITKEKRVCIR